MSELLSTSPEASGWTIDAIRRHGGGMFGSVVPAVIWSDASDENGESIVPVDPLALAAGINRTRLIVLHNHDPGKPIGRVLECAVFQTEGGRRFVAAVLGYYAGGGTLSFDAVGVDASASAPSPQYLPTLPEDVWIEVATDSREVDASWLGQVIEGAPLRVKHRRLSHNAAEAPHELIRVGLAYLVVVWNPYVTAIASEAGKATYAAVFGWLRKLLEKLNERRNPILDVQSFQDGCQVSFLFRGKDVSLHYAAHDALSEAAAQAAQLISNLKTRGVPANTLVYEFNKDASGWYPSYALLEDGSIITDNIALIAVEQLPKGLSLGLYGGKPNL